MINANFLTTDKAGKRYLLEDVAARVSLWWRSGRCWLILLTTIFAGTLAFIYVLVVTPLYKAEILLHLGTQSHALSAELFLSEYSAEAEIERLQSPFVLGKTVEKLDLTTQVQADYFSLFSQANARLQGNAQFVEVSFFYFPADNYAARFRLVIDDSQAGRYSLYNKHGGRILSGITGELAIHNGYRLLVSRIDAHTGAEFMLRKNSRSEAVEGLKKSLSVALQDRKNAVFVLSLRGDNKQKTVEILNALSQNYLLLKFQQNSREVEQMLQFLRTLLPVIKSKWRAAEARFNHFRLQNERIDLGGDAQSILNDLFVIEAQLNELRFKEQNTIPRFSKNAYLSQSLVEKRERLLVDKRHLDKRVEVLPKVQQEVLSLTFEVQSNRQLYLYLLNKVQALSLLRSHPVNILGKVHADSVAIAEKATSAAIIAAFLGCISAISFLLLNKVRHKGVENPEEIEALGMPVYACIPQSNWSMLPRGRVKNGRYTKEMVLQRGLLAQAHPSDLSIEALRSLITQVHFALLEAKNNVLMISGVAAGGSHSFIAANFAAVLAGSGRKVLYVDADIKQGLFSFLRGKPEKGLAELLSGKSQIQEAIKKSAVENLDLILRGQLSGNPSNLLLHSRFAAFIARVAKEYDLILIDSSPELKDLTLIGDLPGTALMVAHSAENSVKEIAAAKQRWERLGIDVRGLILNCCR